MRERAEKRRHIVTEMSSGKDGDLTEGGLLHLTVLPVSLSGIKNRIKQKKSSELWHHAGVAAEVLRQQTRLGTRGLETTKHQPNAVLAIESQHPHSTPHSHPSLIT